jgi:predicted Zn-dependent protease
MQGPVEDTMTLRKLMRLTHAGLAAGALVLTVACQVSEGDERALGEEQATYLDSTLALISDTTITGYVTTLGLSLASTTSRADLDWRFAVVNASAVNAFAIPGGFVYVTRGLIEQSDRLEELAGVMAHEVAHVDRRHSVAQLERAGRRDVALLLLCTLTGACDTLGGAIALDVGADAVTAQYSQRDESEADEEGVRIAVRAGIDPGGLPIFLEKVLAQRTDQPTPLDAFFATHPTDEKRIAALRRQIAELDLSRTGTLVRDKPEFHAIQERLRALPEPPPPPTE